MLTLWAVAGPVYVHLYPDFFFSSRRRHTRFDCDWSSDVCSSDLFRYLDLPAVDGQPDAAEDEQAQAGGGDDDVRRQFGPGRQAQPVRRELRERVGHDIGPAAADRGEQVAVGREAQPLVPRRGPPGGGGGGVGPRRPLPHGRPAGPASPERWGGAGGA